MPAMQVYLVRHAHAGDREKWDGHDSDRALSEKGKKQAAGLVTRLQDQPVAQVMSSPYLRCVQTVEPLARARGLRVEDHESLAEGSDWHETLVLVQRAVVPTVMCSQGDVIGGLVMHLVGERLLPSGDARWQKGSTWVLETEAGSVVSARYLEPPA
jgi:8-oxo-dGTP diphosphatase